MQSFLPTIIIRHRRENLKKCSLRGLEGRPDFRFLTYPDPILPDLSGYLMLAIDAPPLSVDDGHCGLMIIDATWRYAEKMIKHVDSKASLIKRSIPEHFRTAYPRRQDDCPNPERGLASIEAIYIAYRFMGRSVTGLLDGYYWKDDFLTINDWN